ncbi:23S rRNA pseudouridine(2604) synthase RluF [Flavihumibacter fluvii]|uniref:23S rRNA pseudouridine(2604) synthase RluF n=1 Tax=Flavihumibacter fluvii TaxID=2838157 RepID=UPI001BDED9AB|nr:23S rRNA pseudouridine(2604) synthase RluF [Flavihumibacter fluvii]ULQ54197.1 23S rRNA pseudouridine(2604) synthase RluF [Flavihumibacter fluvii]
MDQSTSLNKFISDTGYCSRREADELIKAGRVLLNNKTAQLGNRYSKGDQVEVDGSLVTMDQKEKPLYIAFNKPIGITTTTEEGVKANMISFINFPKRIFPIGRLDKDSEGLIFLTNDGDIVNKLLRAGNEHEKEYVVRVNKPIAPGFAEQMSAGIPMLGTVTLPCKVHVTGRQTFNIVLTQGLNRQIRRMCEYLGYSIISLQRIRIMKVKLDKLPSGKWRYLSDAEVHQLKESVKDSSAAARKNKKAVVKPEPAIKHKYDPETKPKRYSNSNSRSSARQPVKGERKLTGKKAEKSLAYKKAAAAAPIKKSRTARPKKAAADPKVVGKYKAFKQKGRQRS